ncbi:Sugar phosphatase YidA [Propionicimonas sp. T2.31MG-18]|uniref:HAD hydrolase family protein n=1 Tax=Propionicimonas sp. T2.31MG-18 TaxID=3157620 RepID=UPI0035F0CABC
MTRSALPAGEMRVLALAVDGTVLTDGDVLTGATVEAIGKVKRAGVRVILTSARPPARLRDVQRRLGIEAEVFVACQGALVGRRSEGGGLEILCEARIDPEKALSLEDRALDRGLSVSRFIGDQWLVRGIDAAVLQEAAISGLDPEVLTGDALHPDMAPHKLVVSCGRDADQSALQQYRRELPFSIKGAFSSPTRLEVTDHQIDKASGLRAALSGLGVHLNQTAGIWACDNDISMLKAVGYSFAMDNASDDVRNIATWVTWRNVDDGVAWAIDQLLAQSSSY